MVKILVVGQTPPPFGGQAVAIQLMLEGKYQQVKLFHVRMAFSREMDEIGNFRPGKLWHLLVVIANVFYARFRNGIPILFYPPAGPNRVPMYRDLVILLSTRWLFKQTVFQFHAAGISELYARLSLVERFLFRRAYFGADLAIRQSEFNPPDGEIMLAKKDVVVPCGIKDIYPEIVKGGRRNNSVPVLLFVGVHCESKGVLVVLDTCRILRDSGYIFKIRFMGKFESSEFKNTVEAFLDTNGLGEFVEFLGVRTGDTKWEAYREADIFLFPSFFESESFGLVVLEAMQFEIPVVATRWRGIPSMVEDGKSGFLVPIKDSQATAEKVALLLKSKALREKMGRRGREIYLDHFTIEKHWRSMEEAFLSMGHEDATESHLSMQKCN
jgi:glycosyltransferase involved in cell wall biosynthesis